MSEADQDKINQYNIREDKIQLQSRCLQNQQWFDIIADVPYCGMSSRWTVQFIT